MLTNKQTKTLKTLLLGGTPYQQQREERKLIFKEADQEGYILRDEFENQNCPLYPTELNTEKERTRYFKKYLSVILSNELFQPFIEIRAKKTKHRSISNPIEYSEREFKRANTKGRIKRRKGSAYRLFRDEPTWRGIALLCSQNNLLSFFFASPYHQTHPLRVKVLKEFHDKMNSIIPAENTDEFQKYLNYTQEDFILIKTAIDYQDFFEEYLKDKEHFSKIINTLLSKSRSLGISNSVTSQAIKLCELYRTNPLSLDNSSISMWLRQLGTLKRKAATDAAIQMKEKQKEDTQE